MQAPGARRFEAEPCAEVVDEFADADAVEHPKLLSNRWYSGLNAADDLSCDKDRAFEERAAISLDVSTASYLAITSTQVDWGD